MPNNKELTKIYLAHKNMLARCYDRNRDCWPNYGGRGIGVCDLWRNSREAFVSWAITSGHQLGLSLDRIDNDKDYSPDNCRWATTKAQLNNQRRSARILVNGVEKTIGEICDELELGPREISRVYKRHSAHRASTYDELFCNHLLSHRVQARSNKCLICDRVESVKWRKSGALCNTCYHRSLRWAGRNSRPISDAPEMLAFAGLGK